MIRGGALTWLMAATTGCAAIAPAPSLAPSEWRVSAVNGRATPPPPASYVMRFEPRRMSGQFGCNHFGGDYRIDRDMLTSGAVSMTEMACSEPADSFEGWGLAIIQRPMRIEWDGARRLQLSNDVGTIELRR